MVFYWIVLAEEIMGLMMAAFTLLGIFLPWATASEFCLEMSYRLIWPALIGLGVMCVVYLSMFAGGAI